MTATTPHLAGKTPPPLSRTRRRLLLGVAAALPLLALQALGLSPAQGADAEQATQGAVQKLRVTLGPTSGSISGHSEIRLPPLQGGLPDILLHPRMAIRSVRIDGAPVAFTFSQGRLRLTGKKSGSGPPTTIGLEYEGSFPEPVPVGQFASDNPDFGVGASITPRGVFLQGSSAWHPRVQGLPGALLLEVHAPAGFLAVTAGRLLGHENQAGTSVSRWETRSTARGLPLSAGPYTHSHRESAAAPVMTYFFSDSLPLAEVYLAASARHVETYARLHGPYPFDHFAVVENFFPTGYGMPSYTLLGSTVLRLPFVPETSLRHEIAHCWWGNGVLVDFSLGNWSEGLTTYVADHLAQEEASPAAAREYRLRLLRDYAQLAAGPNDFPLSRFISRTDPASQAVGYGKAMFLAHMIRQRLGEDAFVLGLRDFFRQWLFREASWRDMFAAFEARGWDGAESAGFLRQWVLEPGAPELSLQEAKAIQTAQGWEVRAVLRQRAPHFDLRLPVRLETRDGVLDSEVLLRGPEAVFSLNAAHQPLRLMADPDCHVFRLLDPGEIPPTVNSVKGARNLTVVVARGMGHVSRAAVEGFLGSLNQSAARVIGEKEAKEATPAENTLFFGYPQDPALRRHISPPASYGLTAEGDWLDRKAHPGADEVDAIFVTMPIAGPENGVTALFHVRPGLDEAAVIDAARRITHYGKESYLGFERGRKRLNGTWPPIHSPLTVEFAP